MGESTRQSVLFPEVFRKPVQVEFDESSATSDGGAVLLGALDRSLGVSELFSECLFDGRQPGKIDHSVLDLVRQRMFAIACGYEDANDAARLRSDPVQKLLNERDPAEGDDLASQATLSRFENSVTGSECLRLGERLAELVIQRHRKRLGARKVRQITLDFDGTRDATHGKQQLSLFNGHFGNWCYFPLLGFITFNQEPEQYLIGALLRSGCSKEIEGTLGILRRIVPRLRELFPRARINVRLDAGFSGPKLLDLLEELKVGYMVGLSKNPVLSRVSASLMEEARSRAEEKEETVQLFGETTYSAGSWKKTERRVVFKAECIHTPGYDPKDNVRFVVTNLTLKPRNLYRRYCSRGDSENRIKELKYGLNIDRTSCHSAMANQFRILLTQAAYVLYQELRLRASRTSLKSAQVSTLRLMLIKIGGIVKRSARRVTLHLSANHPSIDVFMKIARRCEGVPLSAGT